MPKDDRKLLSSMVEEEQQGEMLTRAREAMEQPPAGQDLSAVMPVMDGEPAQLIGLNMIRSSRYQAPDLSRLLHDLVQTPLHLGLDLEGRGPLSAPNWEEAGQQLMLRAGAALLACSVPMSQSDSSEVLLKLRVMTETRSDELLQRTEELGPTQFGATSPLSMGEWRLARGGVPDWVGDAALIATLPRAGEMQAAWQQSAAMLGQPRWEASRRYIESLGAGDTNPLDAGTYEDACRQTNAAEQAAMMIELHGLTGASEALGQLLENTIEEAALFAAGSALAAMLDIWPIPGQLASATGQRVPAGIEDLRDLALPPEGHAWPATHQITGIFEELCRIEESELVPIVALRQEQHHWRFSSLEPAELLDPVAVEGAFLQLAALALMEASGVLNNNQSGEAARNIAFHLYGHHRAAGQDYRQRLADMAAEMKNAAQDAVHGPQRTLN